MHQIDRRADRRAPRRATSSCAASRRRRAPCSSSAARNAGSVSDALSDAVARSPRWPRRTKSPSRTGEPPHRFRIAPGRTCWPARASRARSAPRRRRGASATRSGRQTRRPARRASSGTASRCAATRRLQRPATRRRAQRAPCAHRNVGDRLHLAALVGVGRAQALGECGARLAQRRLVDCRRVVVVVVRRDEARAQRDARVNLAGSAICLRSLLLCASTSAARVSSSLISLSSLS